MRDVFTQSVYFGFFLSLGAYFLGIKIRKVCRMGIFNPLLVAIVLIIAFLCVTHIPFEDYNEGADYLTYLLTPATVCLAIPLYQQIRLLKENGKAIFLGIVSGVLTSLGSILGLSVLFGLNHEQYVTMLPKSITTAIGMGVSQELGGDVTITVAVIIVTGVLGNICAESVCRIFRITHPVAKGIAIGTSAHAIGTAKAMEMGEIEGAMSSLSIVIAGICTMVGASFFAGLY